MDSNVNSNSELSWMVMFLVGGGDIKIESHKVNFKDKAQSKVGSMDNVSHTPGGGNIKVRN